ncbi:MAG: bifunctional DNA primase/polymerase [Geminicoccaceae bacterium]|nr:bifunctional DNA primase/polymerase [Geminicoccaceae bacterium]
MSALERLGWRLVPVRSDKVPLVKGWPSAASADPEQWRAWLRRWPRACLALVTGPASNVLVLDIDAPSAQHATDGRVAFEAFEASLGRLPPGPVAETPSGGRHLFFVWPRGRDRIPSRSLAPGLDLKGSGGLVTLPTGARTPGRRWLEFPDIERGLPEVPVRWLARILPLPSVPKAAPVWRPPPGDRYAAAALGSAVERVANAAPGTRNTTLFREAVSLARLNLDRREIAMRLAEAAAAAGLERREVAATLRSALERERPSRSPAVR